MYPVQYAMLFSFHLRIVGYDENSNVKQNTLLFSSHVSIICWDEDSYVLYSTVYIAVLIPSQCCIVGMRMVKYILIPSKISKLG